MRVDPLLCMALYIVWFVLAGIHLSVLFKNILAGNASLATGRISLDGMPMWHGLDAQPSTFGTFVQSEYSFCDSGSFVDLVSSQTTSFPGFRRPTVQFGVQV